MGTNVSISILRNLFQLKEKESVFLQLLITLLGILSNINCFMQYSLPIPQGGKHAVNPRLVEDAKRPHQKPSRLARTKTDALEPDYIAGEGLKT